MTQQPMDSRDDEFRLEKYWDIIKNRSPVLFLFVLLALALGVLKIFTSDPSYRATGVLMVKPENDNVVIFRDRLALGRTTNEYFNTQVRILRSRSLAKTVLEEFNPTPYNGILKGAVMAPRQKVRRWSPGFNNFCKAWRSSLSRRPSS